MPLRAAVLGLGVGERHAQTYAQHADCQLVAICDYSAEKQAEVAARYPGVRTTSSAEDILHDPEIDVVSIASFDDDHCEQVITAVSAGKHVFVEKPLCQTAEQLAEIKATWLRQERQVQLRSNLVLRAAPAYKWLRNCVSAGDLGEIYAFDGDYLYGRLPKLTDGWRGERSRYSVMTGGGIHLVDLMVWITGKRPARVAAWGNQICTQGSSFRHPDYVAATMRFADGMLARISANFGCVHGHQHVVRAFGTRGTFLYDDAGPRLQMERDPAPPARTVDYAALPQSKGAVLAEFIDALAQGYDLSAETQLDFDVASICLACDQALECESEQEVQYL